MIPVYNNRLVRPVRVITEGAVCDGLLTVGLGQRTLDELNQDARPFITLHDARAITGRIDVVAGPLAVNKAGIVMLMEIPEIGAALSLKRPDTVMNRNARAVVRLTAGPFVLHGEVPAMPGSDVLMRLNRAGTRFVALTSVSLEGLGMKGSAPFVAVHWPHVSTVQVEMAIEAQPEDPAAEPDAA